MEVIIPILFQLFAGGAGGNVVGQVASSLNLGTAGNTIVGAIGGIMGILLVGMTPALSSLVDATPGSPGVIDDIDLGALAGQGAVGLIGGMVLTLIVGLIKSALAKSRALR